MSDFIQPVDPQKLPRHIAVIMDGNGRWARKRRKPRVFGHRAGTDATRRIVRACGELGVSILTVYVFSSENWRRPSLEVSALMRLLIEMIHKEVGELMTNNVKLDAIGDLSLLPEATRRALLSGIETTRNNTGLRLNLAVSYSGRTEIVNAARHIAHEAAAGRIDPEHLDEERFSQCLYTAGMPDPDLLIRTGGDIRISNFLLWQLAYTEIYVTPTLWPDFDRSELVKAIVSYQTRERRFGRVPDKEQS